MDMGGAELQLTQQLALFPEYDITLSILSHRHNLLSHVKLPHQNIKIYGQGSLQHLNSRGLRKAIPVAWKMMQHCRAEKIKRVIAHLPMAHWTARWMVLFSYVVFSPLKLIAYHHSEQYKVNALKGFFQKVFRTFQSLLAFVADSGNIFVSQKVKEDISQNQYVRNGIVIKNLVEEKRSDSSLAKQILAEKIFQQYIVIPGRIERVKGQVFFIKSLTSELIEKIKSTNALIVFAGGGSDKSELMNLIPDDLKEYIFITGTLEHPTLLSFLSMADLVVIPSLSEGFGNILVEGMMLKRNVLSSNAGGLNETIRDSKVIEWFEAGDVTELQQKITAYFSGQLYFQPEKAYAFYRANFTPEVHRENILRYLKQTWA
jgi:glycosyltransferase involved in cell wall biosynthesis